MTDKDLAVLVQAIAPIVKEYAAKAVGDAQARIAVLEAQLMQVGDVRDRVITMEVKMAQPPPSVPAVTVDLAPVLERVSAAEAQLKTIGDVRDKVIVMETKAGMLTPAPAQLEMVNGPTVTDVELAITKAIAPVNERLAVLETKAPIPGPAGKDGADGLNGKDGSDGMGWDDLSVKHDGERTFTVQLIKGERVKDAGSFTLPVMIYRGVFVEGKTYEPGDAVSWGGSVYHCKKTTVLKPDTIAEMVNGEYRGAQGRDFWTMVVRAGREGKPGRDGLMPTPVVKVG